MPPAPPTRSPTRLHEILRLLAVALLPPPRRLDTVFDRIERMP